MRKFAALMATAAMALTIGGISVAAADSGYNANLNASVSGACHGAFGAFSHHFAFSTGFQPPTDAHSDKALGLNGDGNVYNPNSEVNSADVNC